ncbi:hypothetical protein [Endozoicomonas sp. SESOKO3]|uniref:hypothetical protein n=2 Tax=unclassified Endozoicomonas TaxID=2644528 RepID=UPI0021491AD0|nr:hypothetical protein [Endozoicomonas sp. SESOKO3]
MIISRSGLAGALLSVVYAFPSHAFTKGGSTGSYRYTEVSGCSEFTSRVDRDVCSHHLSVLKDLIRKKNNQVSSTRPSPSASPIPETVKIRKISGITSRLDYEVLRTFHPTLFIFDAERSSEKGQRAVYELQLSEPVTGSSGRVNSFQLPDNSAFVGNGTDILPEFVIRGSAGNQYVMSATRNDSVYYLANIEINSRNPIKAGRSTATVTTGNAGATPTRKYHTLAGILDLKGAGLFVADNIRVVLDPANSNRRIKPVNLGCTDDADGIGPEEHFVYRFMHSEFALLQGVQGSRYAQPAAMNVECDQKTGQVQLTMKNTKTVISVSSEMDTLTPGSSRNSGVLFSISLSSRENVLSFVDSTCNSVVDQHGNDLSIDTARLSDPDHFMGRVYDSTYCSDIKMINGAFGLKEREQAWGWIPFKYPDQHPCSSDSEKRYRAGFAPVSAWSSAGFDVACHCTMPTSASSTVSPSTTQAAYTPPELIYDVGHPEGLVMNNTVTAELKGLGALENLTTLEKMGVGAALLLGDQTFTQIWFHLSKRIRQAWIRRTSQVLATILGLGIPAVVDVVPKCFSGLRGGRNLLGNKDFSKDPALLDPGRL